jgi:transcriptional regulator with XRE-family HTH domain
MTTAERIRFVRDRRGLTQLQLADAAGIPQTTLSHYERGQVSIPGEAIRRLAIALEVSTDYLLRLKATPS